MRAGGHLSLIRTDEALTMPVQVVGTVWKIGIAATGLPPRMHLGLKIAGPLCAAI
jgi:hypothetical protein